MNYHNIIGVWCNGSTTDFGSVSGGSNPPTLTINHKVCLREKNIALQRSFGVRCQRSQDLGMLGRVGENSTLTYWGKDIRSSNGTLGRRNGSQMNL